MTSYDDPWAYCARLFFTRLLMFVALSLLLWMGVWAALLHWVFGADGMAILSATWTVLKGAELVWQVIFLQAGALALLLATVVYLLLMARTRAARDTRVRGPRLAAAASA